MPPATPRTSSSQNGGPAGAAFFAGDRGVGRLLSMITGTIASSIWDDEDEEEEEFAGSSPRFAWRHAGHGDQQRQTRPTAIPDPKVRFP
jgi:hypothetical protein